MYGTVQIYRLHAAASNVSRAQTGSGHQLRGSPMYAKQTKVEPSALGTPGRWSKRRQQSHSEQRQFNSDSLSKDTLNVGSIVPALRYFRIVLRDSPVRRQISRIDGFSRSAIRRMMFNSPMWITPLFPSLAALGECSHGSILKGNYLPNRLSFAWKQQFWSCISGSRLRIAGCVPACGHGTL